MIWKQPLRWILQKLEKSCIQVKAWNLMLCLWKWACVMIQASTPFARSLMAHSFACHQVRLGTLAPKFSISSRQEDVSIQREERLKEQRGRELLNKAEAGRLWGLCSVWNSCLWGVLLVFLVICLVVRLESYAVAVVLCLGAGCLCCCTCQISLASFLFFDAKSDGAREVAKHLSKANRSMSTTNSHGSSGSSSFFLSVFLSWP